MTETEAHAKLKQLHAQYCTCGEKSHKVARHKKCRYRMQAWMPEELREFVGSLYEVADPEAVAA